MAELDQALAKIRPHTSSNLAHQKTPATLLLALETTFQEQTTQRTSTAYFAALLTTLDGTLQKKDISLGDGDVLPAELYLLALVAPFVSQSIIRAHLNTILSLTAPLFPLLLTHAPPLRSQLSLYHTIFRSLDKSQLETQGIRQAFASILQLCVDSRPKVRKAAADLVKDVLSEPPSPMARHPYADRTAEWLKSALGEASANALPRAKSTTKLPETPTTESAIHILTLLRPITLYLPPAVSIPFHFLSKCLITVSDTAINHQSTSYSSTSWKPIPIPVCVRHLV
jgi:ribosomal RNA-processing protein 12